MKDQSDLPSNRKTVYLPTSVNSPEGMEIPSINGKGWRGGYFIIEFAALPGPSYSLS